MALVVPDGEGQFVIAGLDPAIHPFFAKRWTTEIGFTRFRRFRCASRINPACVVKPAGDVAWMISGAQLFAGIAIRRPAASGRGRLACEAFMRASPRATSSGKGAVFPAGMSTCSDMFSEVAETQPSLA
jgi:hypothetical protein